ncbi:Aste57867_9784 [Aphanomyces stellatus]|uniref:Aste57867_9784 protein n=1 Tax=Aphanomyces stellatus TaxID=120398 RepID=A0A485KP67_9STRA|nr:hypothetical protein As57867_009745 [Aphanomyces stellatus]VFT86663.1 Aste57867_9784 [Aphanomyces stellatus]
MYSVLMRSFSHQVQRGSSSGPSAHFPVDHLRHLTHSLDSSVGTLVLQFVQSHMKQFHDGGLFCVMLSTRLLLDIVLGDRYSDIPKPMLLSGTTPRWPHVSNSLPGLHVALDWSLESIASLEETIDLHDSASMDAVLRGILAPKRVANVAPRVYALLTDVFLTHLPSLLQHPTTPPLVRHVHVPGVGASSKVLHHTVYVPGHVVRTHAPLQQLRVALFNVTLRPTDAPPKDLEITIQLDYGMLPPSSTTKSSLAEDATMAAWRAAADRLYACGVDLVLSQKKIPPTLATYLLAHRIASMERLSILHMDAVQAVSGAAVMSDWAAANVSVDQLGVLDSVEELTVGKSAFVAMVGSKKPSTAAVAARRRPVSTLCLACCGDSMAYEELQHVIQASMHELTTLVLDPSVLRGAGATERQLVKELRGRATGLMALDKQDARECRQLRRVVEGFVDALEARRRHEEKRADDGRHARFDACAHGSGDRALVVVGAVTAPPFHSWTQNRMGQSTTSFRRAIPTERSFAADIGKAKAMTDAKRKGGDESGDEGRGKENEETLALDHEVLQVGEIIAYYSTVFVAGDPRGRRESKVLRIRSDIMNDYPVHLESQDTISRNAMVKRIKDADGDDVKAPGGGWRKVYTYELIPGKIRGESASAVLKAAMKNVVRDAYAAVYGTSNVIDTKKDTEKNREDRGKMYKPKKSSAKSKSSSTQSISISKFFTKLSATSSHTPTLASTPDSKRIVEEDSDDDVFELKSSAAKPSVRLPSPKKEPTKPSKTLKSTARLSASTFVSPTKATSTSQPHRKLTHDGSPPTRSSSLGRRRPRSPPPPRKDDLDAFLDAENQSKSRPSKTELVETKYLRKNACDKSAARRRMDASPPRKSKTQSPPRPPPPSSASATSQRSNASSSGAADEADLDAFIEEENAQMRKKQRLDYDTFLSNFHNPVPARVATTKPSAPPPPKRLGMGLLSKSKKASPTKTKSPSKSALVSSFVVARSQEEDFYETKACPKALWHARRASFKEETKMKQTTMADQWSIPKKSTAAGLK